MEACGGTAAEKAHEGHDDDHDDGLVEVVPPLHEDGFEPLHEVSVIEAAGGAEQCGGGNAHDPDVMAEVYALASSGAAEHEERQDGQPDTDPLQGVETLAEDQKSSDEHHHWTCGVDGADDGDGQVLDAVVSECPRREYYHGLQCHEYMVMCRTEGYAVCRGVEPSAAAERGDDRGQEYERHRSSI